MPPETRGFHPVRTSRSWLTWALGYGIGRAGITRAAKQGDLVALLQVDEGLHVDPFPAYEEIRAAGPRWHTPIISATVDHALGSDILRSQDFGVGGGHAELPRPVRRLLDAVSDVNARGPLEPPSMLAVDPPDHTRYRKLVSRVFTVRAVQALEPRIEATAQRLLDQLDRRQGDTFDLVNDYAALLPVEVISDILGVPLEMRDDLLQWGNGAAASLDPALTWQQYRVAEHCMRELHEWFAEHVRTLRRDPGDDLLSRLARLEGEDRLTDLELHATGLLILGAGFETTVSLIGNGAAQLVRHPDQLALLQADPGLWPNAVEEVLRYDSPVQMTLRQAYADTEVRGVRFAKNEAVLVLIGGANRDPQVFTDPHVFDVTRDNASTHLAFSSGIHYCLGAGLARLEGTVALRTLFDRYPDLQLIGDGERRETRILRGHERLPVRSHAQSEKRSSGRLPGGVA